MYKFALTSTGPLSSKTTLAKYLEANHGFILAEFSRALAEMFVEQWNAPLPHETEIGLHLTLDQLYKEKEAYRPLLQKFGDWIGYNDPDKAEQWVLRSLNGAGFEFNGGRSVVFDSFRGEQQAQVLRGLGFTLVQLEISETERRYRAGLLGKSYPAILDAMDARPDLELGIADPDIRLRGEVPTELQARILLNDPDDAGIFIRGTPKRG